MGKPSLPIKWVETVFAEMGTFSPTNGYSAVTVKDTELYVKSCETCAILARKNPLVPLSSRELPDKPWEVLQIDFLSVPGFGSGELVC